MLIINDYNILLKDNANKAFVSWPCCVVNNIRMTVKGLQGPVVQRPISA